MGYRGVIFDIGGVICDSPLHAIARFERECGIPEGFVNRVVVDTGPSGAWSRLERGELSVEAFHAEFEADCVRAGQTLSAGRMMEHIAGASAPRPAMLSALGRIRDEGLRLAALTNNWRSEAPREGAALELRPLFDVFVESSVVGLRKPDPRIYTHACDELGVEPQAAVFLDDIGRNLKAARALGMATIKVEQPDTALAELEGLLGFALN